MCEMGQAVDVICVCDAGGEIRPLRLRVGDADGVRQRVDIGEVVSIRRIEYVGVESIIFLCRAEVQGRERLFELRYLFRSHTWRLLQSLC